MKTKIIRADHSIFMTSTTSLFDDRLSLKAKYLMVCIDYLADKATDELRLEDLLELTINHLTPIDVDLALQELDKGGYVRHSPFGIV